MSLRTGAETIVDQCLNVQQGESVVVVNDGIDHDLIEALLSVAEDHTARVEYLEYDEPASHGAEPPQQVADAMRASDVFIAPTKKSLSHTQARINACEHGARGATMPTITKEIWNTSLQADYREVSRLCTEVSERIQQAEHVHITTPSGTDLSFTVEPAYYMEDAGFIHEPGRFGNLPAGETFGAPVQAEGTLVIDHFPFAPAGTIVEIEDNRAVAVEHPGNETSELAGSFDTIAGARNVAEFGVGTNPAATLIGNLLQDEKVLGTVHIAFGDNSSMVPDDDPHQVSADLHVDTVCESPTVHFDDVLVLEAGDPLFR